MKQLFKTREEWLVAAIQDLRDGLFKQSGAKVPDLRVSIGFPHGRGAKAILAQHWHPKASGDGKGSIFITPRLEAPVDILAALVHEMVHAAVGNEADHGPVFRKLAIAVGLAGKMRSTHAGAELTKRLNALHKKLGKFPHAKLDVGQGPIKKQTTRMIKMECMQCGFIARASHSAIIAAGGSPYCFCSKVQMYIHIPEEE